MDIAVDIVYHLNVIDQVVVIEIQVVDPGILIVKAFFKTFECLRFWNKFITAYRLKLSPGRPRYSSG